LPDLSNLELEEIILIDPIRLVTRESIINLYNIDTIDPSKLNVLTSNDDLMLSEGFEKLFFTHVISPNTNKLAAQIDDSELEMLYGLKYIYDSHVINDIQDCEVKLNTTYNLFYQKSIKRAKEKHVKEKEMPVIKYKEDISISDNHFDDYVSSKK